MLPMQNEYQQCAVYFVLMDVIEAFKRVFERVGNNNDSRANVSDKQI